MELLIPQTSLLVFVDDTGHESLIKDHLVYGLGGCAILAVELESMVRQPWRDIRKKVNGSVDAPLHAASLARTASTSNIDAVAGFFRDYRFGRLGAIISVRATRLTKLSPVEIIAGVLKNRIVDIARWTPFTAVNVIFEASKRADHLIEQAFGDFRLEENGQKVPVDCSFMPKAIGEPALEVADFIMHAVGRQAKRRIDGRDGFTPDFQAVFHGQDPKRVSFIDVEMVQESP